MTFNKTLIFLLFLFNNSASLFAGEVEQNLFPLYRNPTLKISKEQINNLFATKYPELFTGCEKIDHYTIEQIRAPFRNDFERGWLEHLTSLEEPAHNLKEKIKSLAIDDRLKNKLLCEIDYKISAQEVTYYWFLSLTFRVLALEAYPSEQEFAFFKHSPHPWAHAALFAQNPDISEAIMSFNITKPSKKDRSSIFQKGYISTEMFQELEKRVAYANPNVYYPVFGVGIFGLAQMVSDSLDRTFLLGMPDKQQHAHGIQMSQGGFAVHDLVHGLVDTREEATFALATNLMERYINQGGDARVFLELYPPYAAKNEELLKKSLESIYKSMLTELLPTDEPRFNKALVGFFLIMHEFPFFSPNTYAQKNLEVVLDSLIIQQRNYIERAFGMAFGKEPDVEKIIEDNKGRLFAKLVLPKGMEYSQKILLEKARRIVLDENTVFKIVKTFDNPRDSIIEAALSTGEKIYYKGNGRFWMNQIPPKGLRKPTQQEVETAISKAQMYVLGNRSLFNNQSKFSPVGYDDNSTFQVSVQSEGFFQIIISNQGYNDFFVSYDAAADFCFQSSLPKEVVLTEEEKEAVIACVKEFAIQDLPFRFSAEALKNYRTEYELSVVNDLLTNVTIQDSDSYIDLEFHFRNGQIIEEFFAKNQSKWDFYSDYIGLLNSAGIHIEWPSLEGLSEKEKIDVMNSTFKEMRNAFLEVLEVFNYVAKKYVTRSGRGGSLSEHYQRKRNDHEAVLNILLKNLETHKAKH